MEQSAQNKLPDWEIKWQFCKPLIEPALKHQDSYTIDDVEDKVDKLNKRIDGLNYLIKQVIKT